MSEAPGTGSRTIRPGADWKPGDADFTDVEYATAELSGGRVARITIARPEVRNAFRPRTLFELRDAFELARDDPTVGVVILTGEGPDAFCSGGDQRVRGDDGYVDDDGIGRLNVLDLQVQIRRLPKPVIAMVAGYAIGGGHVLHVVCDLTIAADNARFGQTGPKVGSFDGGYGSGLLARIVGQKKAREIWYLCEQYDADSAERMGLVNAVVPLEELEVVTVQWCDRMLQPQPAGPAHVEGIDERGRRRARRHPAARRRRDLALLHDRGGSRGQARVPREARAGLRSVPEAAVGSHASERPRAGYPRTQ